LHTLLILVSVCELRNNEEACTDYRALFSGRNKINGFDWESQENYGIELAGICCDFHPFGGDRHHDCRLCKPVLEVVNKKGESIYLIVVVEANSPPYRSSMIRTEFK
jgi:hypothetical protein